MIDVHTTLEEAAREAASNWKEFESFAWHRESDLDDPDSWTIWNTSSRGSGLIEQSNEAAIQEALEPFIGGDVLYEHADHWACGYVDGFAIRVYGPDGTITTAFKAAYDLAVRLSDYPLLDDEDYSRREYEATIDHIEEEGRGLEDEFEMPEDWAKQVFSWLWDNNQAAVESVDDRGGYPSEDEIREAMIGLDWEYEECRLYRLEEEGFARGESNPWAFNPHNLHTDEHAAWQRGFDTAIAEHWGGKV